MQSTVGLTRSFSGLLAIALAAGLAGAGCAVDDAPTSTASAEVGSSCTLGDGYVIASGGNKTVYPVTCPSDCNDFPGGGLPLTLYCLNGVLGLSNPALTGGSVAPTTPASQYNGNSVCTALPNPPTWGQSANRKTCVHL